MKKGYWRGLVCLLALFLLAGCTSKTAGQEQQLSKYEYGTTLKKWTFQGENTFFDTGKSVQQGIWQLPDGCDEKIIGGKGNYYDYQMLMKFRYTDHMADSTVRLLHRARVTTFYGKFFYALEIQNGDTLRLIKCVAAEERELACVQQPVSLGDGEFHEICMDAVDEWLLVWVDGQEVLRYNDHMGDSILYGKYGFFAENAALEISEMQLTRIEDLRGGEEDNILGGKFNDAWDEEGS